MMTVECPWCAGEATIEVAGGDEFCCSACAVRVDIAPEPVTEPAARAA